MEVSDLFQKILEQFEIFFTESFARQPILTRRYIPHRLTNFHDIFTECLYLEDLTVKFGNGPNLDTRGEELLTDGF